MSAGYGENPGLSADSLVLAGTPLMVPEERGPDARGSVLTPIRGRCDSRSCGRCGRPIERFEPEASATTIAEA